MRRIILVAALAMTSGPVLADEAERVPPVTDAATLRECGECHMAFQPALLPARSWERIIGNLSDHFGEDASLPAEIAQPIKAYLMQNAGGGDPQRLRITEQPWFTHEHNFRPSAWARKDVASKSNCEACHQGAAQGIYEDD